MLRRNGPVVKSVESVLRLEFEYEREVRDWTVVRELIFV